LPPAPQHPQSMGVPHTGFQAPPTSYLPQATQPSKKKSKNKKPIWPAITGALISLGLITGLILYFALQPDGATGVGANDRTAMSDAEVTNEGKRQAEAKAQEKTAEAETSTSTQNPNHFGLHGHWKLDKYYKHDQDLKRVQSGPVVKDLTESTDRLEYYFNEDTKKWYKIFPNSDGFSTGTFEIIARTENQFDLIITYADKSGGKLNPSYRYFLTKDKKTFDEQWKRISGDGHDAIKWQKFSDNGKPPNEIIGLNENDHYGIHGHWKTEKFYIHDGEIFKPYPAAMKKDLTEPGEKMLEWHVNEDTNQWTKVFHDGTKQRGTFLIVPQSYNRKTKVVLTYSDGSGGDVKKANTFHLSENNQQLDEQWIRLFGEGHNAIRWKRLGTEPSED